MERTELRNLLLGPAFQPKQQDIPTPHLLKEKGVQDDVLRLVGMSGKEAVDMRNAANGDSMLLSALWICHCLRWRDAESTPVLSMADAPTLMTRDVDLLDELGPSISAFIGMNRQAVDEAKNGSGTTQNVAAGSESPQLSDAALPNASNDLTTANLSNG